MIIETSIRFLSNGFTPFVADMQAEIFAEIKAESKLALSMLADLDFSRFY